MSQTLVRFSRSAGVAPDVACCGLQACGGGRYGAGVGVVVEAWSGGPESVRELVLAYLRAVERFREQDARASDPEGDGHGESLARAALFEALNWADTIDQYLRKGPRGTLGTDRDEEWAAGLPREQERVARAFQRVRNLTHHQWWGAVGVRMSDVDGRQVNEWFWAPLPSSGGRHRDLDADSAFEERLAGRRVLATLDELAEVFFARRTWQVRRADLAQPGHGVEGSALRFDDEAP